MKIESRNQEGNRKDRLSKGNKADLKQRRGDECR